MPQSHDPNAFDDPQINDPGVPPTHSDVPVEEDPIEPEAPRRAASAQFVVDAEVGSEAALREAMDPANQSLADALRLSFRVLQMVMVVLVILFFASGFQTVDEGQSGVLTRWGDIIERDGQAALTPGLKFSAMPYPISEFVIFQAENRNVALRTEFFPRTHAGPGGSIEDMTERASTFETLDPRTSGYVITDGGDIAHARVSARYRIEPAGTLNYVRNVRDAEADRVVRLALRRAMIHVAAERNLQEFIDLTDDVRDRVQRMAQETLDELGTGISIVQNGVSITDAMPALAIRRIFGELPRAQEEAQTAIEQARQRAQEQLVSAAGERYRELVTLISRYEDAHNRGDEERAVEFLAEINERLDSGDFAGQVSRTIEMARAYQSHIHQTLGAETKRFDSLLPAFREHPELVVKERWLQAYGRVLNRPDAEIWYVPAGVSHFRLDLATLHELKELRQKLNLDRRERQAIEGFYEGVGHYLPRARDIQIDGGPGRQLRIDERGRVRGLGGRDR